MYQNYNNISIYNYNDSDYKSFQSKDKDTILIGNP